MPWWTLPVGQLWITQPCTPPAYWAAISVPTAVLLLELSSWFCIVSSHAWNELNPAGEDSPKALRSITASSSMSRVSGRCTEVSTSCPKLLSLILMSEASHSSFLTSMEFVFWDTGIYLGVCTPTHTQKIPADGEKWRNKENIWKKFTVSSVHYSVTRNWFFFFVF